MKNPVMNLKSNPIILGIDAATEACSASLLVGDDILFRYELAPREHTRKLLPMVQSLIAEAGIQLSEVDAVACGQGPGSFTGVRIGIAAAQGLAFGINCPLIGISNLQLLAQGAYRVQGETRVLTALDARMQEVYFAAYAREHEVWVAKVPEQVIAPATIMHDLDLSASWCAVGTGFTEYAEPLNALFKTPKRCAQADLPNAQDLLPLAKNLWLQGKVSTPETLEPTYLRNDVTS